MATTTARADAGRFLSPTLFGSKKMARLNCYKPIGDVATVHGTLYAFMSKPPPVGDEPDAATNRLCVTLFTSVPAADTVNVPSFCLFLSARRSAAFSSSAFFSLRLSAAFSSAAFFSFACRFAFALAIFPSGSLVPELTTEIFPFAST